jgi:cyclase
MPLALGGGIRNLQDAKLLLDSGAEKVVVNSLMHTEPEVVRELVRTYGSQCVVGSIDYKKEGEDFAVYVLCGTHQLSLSLREMVRHALSLGIGELYLNSMDKDGTGQGYCMEALEQVEKDVNIPIIMAGGAGNYRHLFDGINHSKVDAVATANLFNFVGNGLPRARAELLQANVALARWASAG